MSGPYFGGSWKDRLIAVAILLFFSIPDILLWIVKKAWLPAIVFVVLYIMFKRMGI